MGKKLKAVFLISVLVPYVLFLSEYSELRIIPANTGEKYNVIDNQIVNEVTSLYRVFNQPGNPASPNLPIKFISSEQQRLLHHSLQRIERDHYNRKYFYQYQPIPVYKISLSVFTSDG